jgi:Amt family ammonium transporter
MIRSLITVCLLVPLPARAAVDSEGVNMVWLATASALVFLMQAGFALLESGMSRAKNALNVVMKNYMDVCLGTMVFWALGYGLMFGDNPSGLFGTTLFAPGQADAHTWGLILFQIMFAATATTIASGAMAERTRYHAYLIGAAVITGFIYPVFGSWVWNNGGWLAQLGFVDFAGSTVVHSVGGWCALAGILVLGPRLGRFDERGRPREIRGHNLSLVALGGFILWFGWFGFNGGSTLLASADIGLINLNTQLAAAAGAAGTLFYSALRRRPILLTETVNGSLAGLVAITAGCATMAPPFALLTGVVGGVLCSMSAALLLAMRLDDVIGAVPVHGVAGAWGTLAAGLFFQGDLFDSQRVAIQMLGILACFGWVFFCALLMYLLIALTTGLRAPAQHEQRGLDLTEHAEIGYPEFPVDTAYTADMATRMEVRS